MKQRLGAKDHILTRVQDYCGRRTPWQRRLWNPGTILLLEELVEVADLNRAGKVGNYAVKELAGAIKSVVGPDRGLGDKQTKDELTKLLDMKRTTAVDELRIAINLIRPNYIQNWINTVRDHPQDLKNELFSRLLTGHLLDLGYSPHNLYSWASGLKNDKDKTIIEVLESAQHLAAQELTSYEVVLPLRSLPGGVKRAINCALSGNEMALWLREKVDPTIRLPTSGGLIFEVRALDRWAAVDLAFEKLRTLKAHAIVGTPNGRDLTELGMAFVAGWKSEISLSQPRRQVDIHSLGGSGRLLAEELRGPSNLSSAIDLVSLLEHATPGAAVAAVAGGWAGVEAILGQNRQATDAAEDLSYIIACSFARVELTTLAYKYAKHGSNGALKAEILGSAENRNKAAIFARAIREGTTIKFELDPEKLGGGKKRDPAQFDSDIAALGRMTELLTRPSITISRLRTNIEISLRRLYRQRNSLLHSAANTLALKACLRTSPSLVGAGFEGIIHSALSEMPETPIRLAARARVELSLLGSSMGREPWELLENRI